MTNSLSPQKALVYSLSRVTPGSSYTTAMEVPAIRLNMADLPTLGRPTMAICGTGSKVWGSYNVRGRDETDRKQVVSGHTFGRKASGILAWRLFPLGVVSASENSAPDGEEVAFLKPPAFLLAVCEARPLSRACISATSSALAPNSTRICLSAAGMSHGEVVSMEMG